MKQYVIDELRPVDHRKLKQYLDDCYAAPGFENLYWFQLDGAVAEDKQKAHARCGPHYFALELMSDRLICELLVRTNQRVKCTCIQYASERQRNWLIQAIDTVFRKLEIIA